MTYHLTSITGVLTLPALVSGDIVYIAAGSYKGFSVFGLTNVQFIPEGGVVNFTSSISLGNTKSITFDGTGVSPYGFTYSGTDFSVFNSSVGNNVDITVKGFNFGNTAHTAFDSQSKIYINGVIFFYSGTESGTVYTRLTVDHCRVAGKTSLHIGTFEACSTYRMVNMDCTYTNIVVVNDGTGSCIKISGSSQYGITVKNWTITGANNDTGDVGVFFINGNITIDSVKRIGGYGYLIRLIQTSLYTQKDSVIQNCIDVNTTHYGMCDVRNDAGALNSLATIPLKGGNISFLNNIAGNRTDNGTYVTNAVVAGNMCDETGHNFTLKIKNNFTYNAMASAMANNTSLIKTNYDPTKIVLDMTNNVDLVPGVPLPTGYLVDQINFVPVTAGPLVGIGVAITGLTVDINGATRTNPPDIGAVQSAVVTPPPPPPPVVPVTIVSSVSNFVTKTIVATYSDGTTKTLS